jgi:hypothetical protein
MNIFRDFLERPTAEIMDGICCALTIIHGDDVYKPIMRREYNCLVAEYHMNGVVIGVMISILELKDRRISLEEYARNIRKKAINEYIDRVESSRKEEWNNALKDWKEKQEDNKC